MAYQPQTYQDGVTEYTDTLFQHMDDGIFGAYPVQLIAISSTAPSTCAKDDKYYNTSTKKIYTATATNTWGSNGETPLEDTSYWLISENGNYAWDSTDLVSIGGGKAEVIISDTEPEDGKLWVDTAEIPTIASRDNLVKVSNEVDEEYKVNLLETKNLFDKNNFNELNVFINENGMTSNNDARTLWIPITGGKTYTISNSQAIARFRLCTTQSIPQIGTTTSNYVYGDGETDLSITTSASAKYLLVYYYLSGTETRTRQSILDTLQIELGDEATTYSSFVPNQIVVDNEKYTDTINVGSVVDSRSRVNFLKGKNLIQVSNIASTTENGITYSIDNGTISLNGTASASLTIYSTIPIPLKAGNYTYSSNIISGSYTGVIGKYLGVGSTNYIDGGQLSAEQTRTLSTGRDNLVVKIYIANGVVCNNLTFNLMLNEGSTALPYEPYITPSINVDGETIYQEPVLLWQNPDTSQSFAGQEITLNEDISKYKYYEVIVRYLNNQNHLFNTGRIPTTNTTIINCCSTINYRRFITSVSGNKITFGNGQKVSTYGTGTDDNTYLIPYQILGYK